LNSALAVIRVQGGGGVLLGVGDDGRHCPAHCHGGGAQRGAATASTTVVAGRVGRTDGSAAAAHTTGVPCVSTKGGMKTALAR
jgi:hypothetical protein